MIRNNLASAAEDPEVQEALSHKLSHGRWTVPLANGKIAVFNHPQGSLRCVCDTWEEALSVHVPSFADPAREHHRKAQEYLDLDVDLGDLGGELDDIEIEL